MEFFYSSATRRQLKVAAVRWPQKETWNIEQRTVNIPRNQRLQVNWLNSMFSAQKQLICMTKLMNICAPEFLNFPKSQRKVRNPFRKYCFHIQIFEFHCFLLSVFSLVS